MKKFQISNAKFQRSSKHQIPMQTCFALALSFDVWDLKFPWSLEFGFWNFMS